MTALRLAPLTPALFQSQLYMFLYSYHFISVLLAHGLPCGSAEKEFACNVGDLGSIHGLGRSPGEGKGYPLQYSGLKNSMDYIVHGVTESDPNE